MRFAMVDHGGKLRLVLATETGLIAVEPVCQRTGVHRSFGLQAPPRTVLDLVHHGALRTAFAEAVAGEAKERFDGGEAAWRMPFRPRKIVAVGRNYRAHAEELGNRLPEKPILFGKEPSVCVAPGDPIRIPPDCGRVDHEGELAVIIGRSARNVSSGEAKPHVAGYTLLNDVTARDLQSAAKEKGLPWYLAKNLDTFCPFGPAVIPRDALSWPPSTTIEVSVNDALRQQGSTVDMIFPLPELIAYISRHMPLEAGDVIATGTPEGVGPLHPGDTVEVRCPDIGALSNPVLIANPSG